MRRAFISEAVNLRKDAAAGSEDKQADDHFWISSQILIFCPFDFVFHIILLSSFPTIAKDNVHCQPI